ncbi:hypothetical protein [Chlorogloea sp. CCALA 695]|uniref:hypothetical protein n=1 Tax=Chlorogloea sp. CCALA 695 TaxID=2107693 RepID=UPI0011B266F2|nr:hypothetical protein [Chlorogloea sp. CCALA 695]
MSASYSNQNQPILIAINNSPVWRQVAGLSVPMAVFCPAPDEPLDTYLDANTSDTFLARDFNLTAFNPITPTNSGCGID